MRGEGFVTKVKACLILFCLRFDCVLFGLAKSNQSKPKEEKRTNGFAFGMKPNEPKNTKTHKIVVTP